MAFTRKIRRCVIAFTASAALTAAGVVAAPPTSAAPNPLCDETRDQAKAIAADGDFTEPWGPVASAWNGTPDWNDPISLGVTDYAARITLRYSADRHCAWGLIALDRRWATSYLQTFESPAVWLDISYDGGVTVSLGETNYRYVHSGNDSSYTAAFSTLPINSSEVFAVRACGYGVHAVDTLKPKYRKGIAVPALGTQNIDDPVACTLWLTP
ncbi:hypothetical protein [Streptomyces sp. NPDC006739]|uniref:hypothetical protein n=1 Tax=Streptomyces sp. NPDC006739 TaxID=3364763 RepID=UPI0036AF9972